jgi:hypothetical protein
MAVLPETAVRRGHSDRTQRLKALQAFANLRDIPASWTNFQVRWPSFFPEWMYGAREERTVSLQELDGKGGTEGSDIKTPPLFYRDCLRAVWARNDPDGVALMLLLGFEREAMDKQRPPGEPSDAVAARPLFTPGQSLKIEEQTIGGLQRGRAVVNGRTGSIDWEFDCEFQQAIYDLMQERWRAMVCPVCGRFFVATKTASKYCSPSCARAMKNRRTLDWFHTEGAARREAKKKALRKALKKPKRKKN